MNINAVGGADASQNMAGAAAGKSGQTDPESKRLQTQIEKLQNELKEISANTDMPADTKMKKRQEIQKQISDLQIQLRQHQIEVQKEEREKKKEKSSFDNLLGTKQQKQENTSDIGISTESMTAMVSADVSVKQANTLGSTAQKMNGKANVLEVEISLDSSRNGSSNVGLKEAELSDARETAQKATASQLSALAQAGADLKSASENEKDANHTEEKAEGNVSKAEREDEEPKENVSGTKKNSEESKENVSDADMSDNEVLQEQAVYGYHPVDVRL